MAGAAQVERPLGTAEASGRAPLRRRERCPACGAPHERRQLVCLGCGERLALESKRAAGKPVIAAVAALATVGVISLALIADALIGSESEPQPAQRAAAAPARPDPAPALARARADAGRRATQERARRQIAAGAGGWPASQAGWTVVLLASSDRSTAEGFAAQARSAGIEAGVISPLERPELGTLWTVFSGVHPDQAGAAQAVSELRTRYPNAFTRFVPAAPTSAAPAQPQPG
jgi:septal ring-binding cell division protein DamX